MYQPGAPDLTALPRQARVPTNPENRALDFLAWRFGNIAGPESSPRRQTSSVTAVLDKCIIVETWDGGARPTQEEKLVRLQRRTTRVGTGCSLTTRARVHVFVQWQGSRQGSG